MVEQQVFRLEVPSLPDVLPMYDAVAMHVVDASEDLLHESNCFRVCDALLLDDVLKELSAVGILHNQVDVLLRLNNLSSLAVVLRRAE